MKGEERLWTILNGRDLGQAIVYLVEQDNGRLEVLTAGEFAAGYLP